MVLLGWFLSQQASLVRPQPWIEPFLNHYVSKCSKLARLDIQVHYHVIYSLGGGHTHTLYNCLSEDKQGPGSGTIPTMMNSIASETRSETPFASVERVDHRRTADDGSHIHARTHTRAHTHTY